MIETVLWESLDGPGHESACLREHRLEGAAAFFDDGKPCCLNYAIDLNEDGTTRTVNVDGWVGDRELHIVIEAANGAWKMNGVSQRQVLGCTDIDLNFSPSTNVLPIRRFNLTIGEARDVRVAWLRFPSFKLEMFSQQYTRLAADRYRFDSHSINFTAELRVSPNGMVLDYENLWRQETGQTR